MFDPPDALVNMLFKPTAVLYVPVVLLFKAFAPMAVILSLDETAAAWCPYDVKPAGLNLPEIKLFVRKTNATLSSVPIKFDEGVVP